MKEKMKNIFEKIPMYYWMIPIIIIGFILEPIYGYILIFLGFLIPLLIADYGEPISKMLFYYGVLFFFIITLPGHKEVSYNNYRDVNVTSFKDEFYVKYKDKNKYRIASFSKIPVCKKYQLADKLNNYNYFGYKYSIVFNNKLKCKK